MSELRLRMFARENYVTSDERDDAKWHPIVIDEMRRRDHEVATQNSTQTVVTSAGIVPLETCRHEVRLDQAHRVPAPQQRTRQRVETNSDEALIPHCG